MTRSIFMQSPSSFFSLCSVNILVVHPYSRINTTAAWKKLCFILSDQSNFLLIGNLSIAVHAFTSHLLMSFSVDEMLLPRYLKLFTNFREPLFNVEMPPF